MIKKWFVRTTPFVVLAVLSTIILLYQLLTEGGGPDGWRYPLLIRLLFLIVGLILIDVLLKIGIPKKTFWIWIIEVFLSLSLIYYWIVT